MNHTLPRACFALLLFLFSCASQALTARIDDTGTSVSGPAKVYWRELMPGNKADNTMEGRVRVQVHLNLQPWQGRSGKIFMALPEQAPGSVRASWPAHGRFNAGTLLMGQRALLYSGPITTPFMEGILNLQLEVDGLRMEFSQQVNFHFEIDLD